MTGFPTSWYNPSSVPSIPFHKVSKMATLQMFSVLDRAAQVFGRPFCAANLHVARRMFSEAVRDTNPENLIHKYPEQFALFQIGEFDESSGDLVSIAHPQPVSEATDHLLPG